MRMYFTEEAVVVDGSKLTIRSIPSPQKHLAAGRVETNHQCATGHWVYAAGFTLVEVVISIAVTGLVFAGVLNGYVQSARNAEWSGYSLAAQALAVQQIEQGRSAVWDYSTGSGRNELTNLNLVNLQYDSTTKTATGYSWSTLDLPYSGTNVVRATNYVTIRMLYFNNNANPPVQLQMMQVDTVWPFTVGTAARYFTNSVATYFAPDNRDPNTL
jgi:type II secretory pathway pseudopilin PulG